VSIYQSDRLPHTDVCADRDPPVNVTAQQEDSEMKSKRNTSKDTLAHIINPYRQDYESNAKIWALYLTETEAEDKELADLWQVGLDQLLIFVRRFLLSALYIVLNHRRPVCSAQSLLLSSFKVVRT
jgi:uncharacterized protein YpmS